MANLSFVEGIMEFEGDSLIIAKYIYLTNKYLDYNSLDFYTKFNDVLEKSSLDEISNLVRESKTFGFVAVGRNCYDCNIEWQLEWLKNEIDKTNDEVDRSYLQEISSNGLSIIYDYVDEQEEDYRVKVNETVLINTDSLVYKNLEGIQVCLVSTETTRNFNFTILKNC